MCLDLSFLLLYSLNINNLKVFRVTEGKIGEGASIVNAQYMLVSICLKVFHSWFYLAEIILHS